MKRIIKQQTPQVEIEKFNANMFVLDNFLFDKQLAFVNDPSPFKIAVCSRRAGKTVACAAHLIHTALMTANATCAYITLTGTSGKRIIWKEFKKIAKDHGLKVKINDLELSLTFGNGSTVYVIGAKDESEIEKIRGIALKLVYIDECQSFREYIKDLVDDVIAPALMDYAGSLCLIGTPGAVPVGFFHDCYMRPDVWARHYWTFWDNPFIPVMSKKTHREIFERELKRRGVTEADPGIQREFYGRWVLDTDSLLLHYTRDKNDFIEVPNNQNYVYILGIDIGYKDADALAVLAWSETDPTTYLVEELVTPKQGITELVEQIQLLQKKYNISKMVMDMGGLGKKIGEEIIRRYLLPVEAADKARKMENYALLNDALRTGKFKAKATSRFAQDSYLLEIDRDKTKPDRIVVSQRYHSDIIDSVLYAFKFSPAYSYEPPTKKLVPGTKEWADSQQSALFEEAMGHFQAQDAFRKILGDFD